MNGIKFIRVLAVINCLSMQDFKNVFGDEYKHFLNKFIGKGLKALFELDNENANIFIKYCIKKHEEQLANCQ